MTQNLILSALSAPGVSVWLDDLSRDRLTSGNLQQLIDTRSVVGVTTNPSIFQHAISHGQAYTRQLTELAERGADADSAIRTVITDDVRAACDILRPQWEASRGVDGRVSIEVDPRLAHDTAAAVSQPPSCGRSSTGRTCSSRFPPRRPGCRPSPPRWPKAFQST
jgi:transaldolase